MICHLEYSRILAIKWTEKSPALQSFLINDKDGWCTYIAHWALQINKSCQWTRMADGWQQSLNSSQG